MSLFSYCFIFQNYADSLLSLLFLFSESHSSAQEGLGDSQERKFQEGTPQEAGPDEDEAGEFEPG